MKRKKSRLIKIRQKFCKHEWPEYWDVTYLNNDGPKMPGLMFYRYCRKCGKAQSFEMPLDNVVLPYHELQNRRKHWLI